MREPRTDPIQLGTLLIKVCTVVPLFKTMGGRLVAPSPVKINEFVASPLKPPVPSLLSCTDGGAVVGKLGKLAALAKSIVFVIEVIKPLLAGKENGAPPKLKFDLANAALVKGRFV
jgi:hypothetical protein